MNVWLPSSCDHRQQPRDRRESESSSHRYTDKRELQYFGLEFGPLKGGEGEEAAVEGDVRGRHNLARGQAPGEGARDAHDNNKNRHKQRYKYRHGYKYMNKHTGAGTHLVVVGAELRRDFEEFSGGELVLARVEVREARAHADLRGRQVVLRGTSVDRDTGTVRHRNRPQVQVQTKIHTVKRIGAQLRTGVPVCSALLT